ncbi:putative carbohydrate esterase family 8 protein [Botryosphaeria dothidea]|uniref:Pectinesterase n=1 Tax=Botryosphaeria dothidea TaxID=55169 RepID=A0A8H4N648_9PEZI|nr:putative carbohydrate esterase family 8 protein [Botryosphaeria dothidea]
MHKFSILLGLLGSAFALTTPPQGALTVGGSGGQYSTVQAAVDALQNTTDRQTIFIWSGTYEEQVYVPKHLGPITIYGESQDDSSYHTNTVTLSFGLSQAFNLSNDLTATLRAHSPDFSLYNVNVENTYGQGSQAVAVSAYGTEQGYYGCKLTGFQDTLLTQRGKHYFVNTYIEGATDFIFGQYSAAWFEKCDLRVPAAKQGYVTASGRNTTNDGWYVINGGSVDAAPGENVTAGAYYLGRPWRNYARVVFQNVYLSEVINPAGWSIWSTSSPQTDHVTFAEFNNSGPGAANASRADFSEQLNTAVAITEVLGSNYTLWVDPNFL